MFLANTLSLFFYFQEPCAKREDSQEKERGDSQERERGDSLGKERASSDQKGNSGERGERAGRATDLLTSSGI